MPTAPDPDVASHAGRSRLWWVPYIFLLRVQIITAALFIAGPFFALSSSILNGIFDLDYGDTTRSAVSMAIVSMAAFSLAWTLLASSCATLYNAASRFGTAPIRIIRFPLQWPEREVFGVLALVPIGVAIGHSWAASRVNPFPMALGALGGLVVAIGLLIMANRTAAALQRDVYVPAVQRLDVRGLRWLIGKLDRPNIREGFIDPAEGRLLPFHMLAWVVFATSLSLYLLVGGVRAAWIGYQTYLSTLACVLLLGVMLCWLLGGLAFFFDRYRAPALAIVGVALWGIGFLPFPGSDHTYRTWTHQAGASPYPHEVLRAGSTTPILVAATGGGIQAAAWTARVLTGIDEELSAREIKDRYTKSIRLLSTVSGGGVGAMYFSERYNAGTIDHDHLDDVLRRAEASSLDDVAWGAVYPDLLGNLFPPIRLVFGDRGQALERAWTRGNAVGTDADPRRSVGALLSDWREQVWSADRPANIFNATLVDTGERLLIGTSRLGWRKEQGLQNYEDLCADPPGQPCSNRDVQVVTAARLAASFTYVSPATRRDGPGPAYHVVDGGYYDDYGMTTLTEWLDEGLDGVGLPKDGGPVARVLVIQIRSSPDEGDNRPDGSHGYFYQALAPAETVLNVRSTGQISHNDEEFARLQRLWKERGVEVDNVVFRFCGEHPPLSWHLTGTDKMKIEAAWAREKEGPSMQAVKAFLTSSPIHGQNPDRPFDAAMLNCSRSSTGQ